MKVLIGADPELFVKDVNTGKFVCAYNLLPGSKENPHPVEYGAIQPDGFAAEFNIDAAATFEEFERNMTAVMRQLQDTLGNQYALRDVPTAVFGFDYIKQQPAKARELGCEPDFNAYTEAVNPRPDGDAVDFRTGAGHIHIGWTNGADPMSPEHFSACCTLVRELDARLGILSLRWDDDKKRRELYGKAGCFRPKSYGVEYRTLSNKWVMNPILRKLVYSIAVQTVFDCAEGRLTYSRELKYIGTDIERIINQNRSEYTDYLLRNEPYIRDKLLTKEMLKELEKGRK